MKVVTLIGTRPEIIKLIVGNVHYLHFGCILFLITLAVTLVVSLLTQPLDKDYVITINNFYELLTLTP